MRDFITLHGADQIEKESAPIERPGFAHVVTGIIRHPAATLREVIANPVQSYAAALAAAGGVYWALNLAIAWAGMGDLPLAGILAALIVVGIPAGISYLYVLTILFDWSCDILGGQPMRRQIRMLLACAGIPGIIALVLFGASKLLIYGATLFAPERPWLESNPAIVWGLWFGDALAFAWSLLLVIKGLKIMNGFSSGRAMAAAVLPFVPLVLLGGLFLMIVWGVMVSAPPAF